MLLRALAGLIKPTEGIVIAEGKELYKDVRFPSSIGILIENMRMLPYLTAFENLKYLSSIKKVATEEDIKEVLEQVGLETQKDVKKFSLGMNQRLNIAQAVFEHPNLILLDEPMNALDEEGISLVYKLLKGERERGACIVIATHNKGDLQELCDEILHIKNGRLEL